MDPNLVREYKARYALVAAIEVAELQRSSVGCR